MMVTIGDGPVGRIVIRLPNWVGDIMMALPAVQLVKQTFPEAWLIGMARANHMALVERCPVFDEVVAASPQTGLGRYQAIVASARRLRTADADLAILMATSFEAALTAWLAGIPVRVGHDTDHRRVLLNKAVEVVDGHRSDGFLDLVPASGAQSSSISSMLRCTESDRQFAEKFFYDAGVRPGVRPVFVNPAAAKTPRAWSADRFLRLVREIGRRHEDLPVLVHDRYPFEGPPGWLPSRSVHTLADASLVELAAVIERCSLYVGNDSGPMHIAAALGVPTVGIYGPSNPNRTAPRGADGITHIAVSAGFSCSPCRERFFKECPSLPSSDSRPPCLNEVSVDQVAVAVDRVLQS